MSVVAPAPPRRPPALGVPPTIASPVRATDVVVVEDRAAALDPLFERLTHQYASMDPRAYERLVAERVTTGGELARPPALERPPPVERVELVKIVEDVAPTKAQVADELFSGTMGRLAVLSDQLTKCRRWLNEVQERYLAKFAKERNYLSSMTARVNLNAAKRAELSETLLRDELAVMSAHKVFTSILGEIEQRLRSMIVDLDDEYKSNGAVRALEVFTLNLDDLYGQVLAEKLVPLYKTLSDTRVVAPSDVRDLLLGPGWQDAETSKRFRAVIGDLPSSASQCTVLDKVFAFYVSTKLLLDRWLSLETDDAVRAELDDAVDTIENHLANLNEMSRKITKLYCKTEGYSDKAACSPRRKRMRETSVVVSVEDDDETPGNGDEA